MKWNMSDGTITGGAPRRGQDHFLESTRDRRIKDQKECRKVDVIEEEMEESQTETLAPVRTMNTPAAGVPK